MKALLWKDYRLQRLVLIAGLALLLGPYAIFLVRNLYWQCRYGWSDWFRESLWQVNMMSLAFSQLTFALLGGNAFAGERADRSAEFLAYLPPSRGRIVLSKATVALLAGVSIWIIGLGTRWLITTCAAPTPADVISAGDDSAQAVVIFGATAALLLGAGWLASAFLASAGLAAGAGIAAPVFLAGTLLTVQQSAGPSVVDAGAWYCALAPTLGLVAFVAGTVYYIRRVEP